MPSIAVDPDESVILRDLQSMLTKSAGSDVVKLLDYEAAPFLAKGENFAGTLLRVDAKIKRNENGEEEKVKLVAKMINSAAGSKGFNNTVAFVKELFVYEKLMPLYKQLEREAGAREEDLLDVVPEYYGGRLNLDENNENEADSDAVLLMENLNLHGYYPLGRHTGLDLEHAKMALKELAHFHALGIALKKKNQKLFTEIKKHLDSCPWQPTEEDSIDKELDHLCDTICKDERIAKYEVQIRGSFEKNKASNFSIMPEAIEPWVTVIHGDYWTNNLLFRKENGKCSGLKIVDFQFTSVSSPTRDLPYFLCGSLIPKVLEKNLDDLLEFYYENFINSLKRLSCDIEPYKRDKFDEQLKKDANEEFVRCVMALKFYTVEFSDDSDMSDIKSSVLMSSEGNDEYVERCWHLVRTFVNKGWF